MNNLKIKEVKQVDFEQMMVAKAYKKVQGLGDRLDLMKQQIDWEKFRPIIARMYYDNKETGGRPHTDELVIARSLVLQSCYNLSDEELEFQTLDRLSFRNFIGFTSRVPDFTTIWEARERLKKNGVIKEVWSELQHQLDAKGYKVEKGVIQDATFIEADLGRKRHYQEKKAQKQGKEITYTERQKSHQDKDGDFSIKHGQVHYGYKDHIKIDVGHQLIREIDVTSASLHDSQINQVKKNDKIAYRDKAYFGTKLPHGVRDMTMKRASRGHKLNGGEQKRNKNISSIRAPGERVNAVIKNIFHGGCTFVKTLERVAIKETFKAFGYNLYQLVTIKRRELARAM